MRLILCYVMGIESDFAIPLKIRLFPCHDEGNRHFIRPASNQPIPGLPHFKVKITFT
jgi:hypothetical protein